MVGRGQTVPFLAKEGQFWTCGLQTAPWDGVTKFSVQAPIDIPGFRAPMNRGAPPLCWNGAPMTYDSTRLLQVALAEIRATPAKPLAAVAAACSVSRKTLVRAFTHGGVGRPSDVRKDVLQQALSTLMTAAPPLSIKDISVRLGFATPRSFARWVKRENGLLPTDLRARLCAQLAADATTHPADATVAGGGDGLCDDRRAAGTPRTRARARRSVMSARAGTGVVGHG